MNEKPAKTGNQTALKRHKYGWSAWEATVGYISSQHSPDAMLKIHVSPLESRLSWSGTVSWGQYFEEIYQEETFPSLLRNLWIRVERSHVIFKTSEDAARKPSAYEDGEWFDDRTQDLLERLMRVTHNVFGDAWEIIIIYQPVETPSKRVQMRLLAKNHAVHVGGRGPSLRDACYQLYRNAAGDYVSHRR